MSIYASSACAGALELLTGGTQPVKQIAAAVGYGSAAQFCREFHRHLGQPPLRVRRLGPRLRPGLAAGVDGVDAVGNPLLRKGGSQTLRQTCLLLLRIPQGRPCCPLSWSVARRRPAESAKIETHEVVSKAQIRLAPFWSAAIPLPLFTIGVISRPGAARPRAEIDGVTPVPPFLLGPPLKSV